MLTQVAMFYPLNNTEK